MPFVRSFLSALVSGGILLAAPALAQVPPTTTAPAAIDKPEEWSPSVNGLRGRLEIVHDTTRHPPQLVIRVVLENVGQRPLSTTNQPDLEGTLYDATGERVPLPDIQIVSRFVTRPQIAVIPGAAQIRFTSDGGGFIGRDDLFAFVLSPLGMQEWFLKPGRYTLKATLAGGSSRQIVRLTRPQPPPLTPEPWHGTLVLPPVTFTLHPPPALSAP